MTVAEIARVIWEACGSDPGPFALEHLPTFPVDVRAPLAERREGPTVLGWEARIGVARGRRADGRVAARMDVSDDMSNRRALITGITGQDGSYLAELLLEKGYEVHGMVRRASTEKFDRIEHLRDRITLHQGDLLDHRSLIDALRNARPDEIYNLAAMSFVAVSWIQPTLTAEFTGVGVTRHARGDARGCPEARFYQASRREMFGKVREVPQTEATPFYPRSPYGVAKAYGHFITVNYRESYDLHAVRDLVQPRMRAAQHPLLVRENGVIASRRRRTSCRCGARAAASSSSTPRSLLEIWDGEDGRPSARSRRRGGAPTIRTIACCRSRRAAGVVDDDRPPPHARRDREACAARDVERATVWPGRGDA